MNDYLKPSYLTQALTAFVTSNAVATLDMSLYNKLDRRKTDFAELSDAIEKANGDAALYGIYADYINTRVTNKSQARPLIEKVNKTLNCGFTTIKALDNATATQLVKSRVDNTFMRLRGHGTPFGHEQLAALVAFYIDAPTEVIPHLVARADFRFSYTDFTGHAKGTPQPMAALPMWDIPLCMVEFAQNLASRFSSQSDWTCLTLIYSYMRAGDYDMRVRNLTRMVDRMSRNTISEDERNMLIKDFMYKMHLHDDEQHKTAALRGYYTRTNDQLKLNSLTAAPLRRYLTWCIRQANSNIKQHTIENKVDALMITYSAAVASWKTFNFNLNQWIDQLALPHHIRQEIKRIVDEYCDVDTMPTRWSHSEDRAQYIIDRRTTESHATTDIRFVCALCWQITELDAFAADTLGIKLHTYLGVTEAEQPKTKLKMPTITTENADVLVKQYYGVPTLWVNKSQVDLTKLPDGRLPLARLTTKQYKNKGLTTVDYSAEVLCYQDHVYTPLRFDVNGEWDDKHMYAIEIPARTTADRDAIYADDRTSPVNATLDYVTKCERCGEQTAVQNNVCYDCSTNEEMGNPSFPLHEHPSMLEDEDVSGGFADNESFVLDGTINRQTCFMVGELDHKISILEQINRGERLEDIIGTRVFAEVKIDPRGIICGASAAEVGEGYFKLNRVLRNNLPAVTARPKASLREFDGLTGIGNIVSKLHNLFGITIRLTKQCKPLPPTVKHATIGDCYVVYNFNREPLWLHPERDTLDIDQLKRILATLGESYDE